MQTRIHHLVNQAAPRAAAEARHNAVGQELRPANPKKAPIEKPTRAPRIISGFIQLCSVKHNLCQSSPGQRSGGEKRLLPARRDACSGSGARGKQLTWNFLPGTEKAKAAICARQEIGEFALPAFLVDVAKA